MGFWGVEVIPGKPQPYDSDNVQGSLYVTQATLGLGSDTKRSILQCAVGHKDPVFLCSLLPEKSECCSLNLEFKDEGVTFSVIGTRSIHLSGYFVSDEGDSLRDEYESDSEEGVADTESDYQSDADEDYSDDSVEYVDADDAEMFAPSPAHKSGVVIEEMVDEETPKVSNVLSKRKRKKKSKDAEKQTKSKARSPVAVSESEDEDGFPISAQQTAKAALPSAEKNPSEELADGTQDIKGKKRKEQDNQQEVKKKNKKKLKGKDDVDSENMDENTDDNSSQPKEANKQASLDGGKSTSAGKKLKKKNKKKTERQEEGHTDNQISSDAGKSSSLSEENQSTAKSSQGRTFSNGLVIKELNMGVPDGKRIPVKVAYSVVPCDKRLSVLISFLRRNNTGKTLVLVGTWYSVEFHGALLRDLGFTAYNSHGTDSGRHKHAAFRTFRNSRSRSAILCATNVPEGEKVPKTVSRIIQFDPPRGAEDYLVRMFGRDPRGLLFLRPQELNFLPQLEAAGVAAELVDLTDDLEQPPIVVGESPELIRLAHRAYSGYMNTYHTHKLQKVFGPRSLFSEDVAACFGLRLPPTAHELATCKRKQVLGGGK